MNVSRTTRRPGAERESFVIARTEHGYRVHSPSAPAKLFFVETEGDRPTCSCPDFLFNQEDPSWRCAHIKAVLARTGAPKAAAEPTDPDTEERAALAEEGRGEEAAPLATPPDDVSQMVVKRSVSPDGRIDSLSVEFSLPVSRLTGEEVVARAARALALQSAVVGRFLKDRPGGGPPQREEPKPGNGGAVAARIVSVGGMDTQYGRRMFLNVLVNGETLRLFGTPTRLAEAVIAAGFPDLAEHLEEDMVLNLPCRVTTKPSKNGKYLNIDRVFPAGGTPAGRVRR